MEPKRSFIRGIWGVYGYTREQNRWLSRRPKVDGDIKLAKVNPYAPPVKVYVFGEDNEKALKDHGYSTVLIDKKPFVWDMEKEQYRHKIEIWRAGLSEVDEVCFLDWDCIPVKPIDPKIWDYFASRAPVQASIYQYVNGRVFSRKGDKRKTSASTCTYIRGKEHCEGIIKAWEDNGRHWQEEIPLSIYIDSMDGGWKGAEHYKNKYEIRYHSLYVWDPKYIRENTIPYHTFEHLGFTKVAGLLGDGKPEGVKARLDNWHAGSIRNWTATAERLEKAAVK